MSLTRMNNGTLIFLLLVILATVPVENTALLTWKLFHSWNSKQEFTLRGNLIWSNEKNEFQIINDDTSDSMDIKDIRDMLEYGWYHVKIKGDNTKEDNNNGNNNNNFVQQTVPACNLLRANFKDQFDITFPRSTLGDRQDSITSFAYTPLINTLAPKSCDYETNDDDKIKNFNFNSRVNVQLDTPAMVLKNVLSLSKPPPGLAFIKQPQQSGEHGSIGSGDVEDPNAPPNPVPSPFSFLQKYWYIILPMIILQFIQAPQEEPQQQGGKEGDPSNTNAGDVDKKIMRRGKRSNNKSN